MHTQNCDIMQIFRIMCKGLWLEIFLIHLVGASLLAMDVNDDAFILNECVALRIIASELAPTGEVTK